MNEFFQIWFNTKNTFKHLLSSGVTNFRLNIYYSIVSLLFVFRNEDLVGGDPFFFIGISFISAILIFFLIKHTLPYLYWQFGKIWKGKANLNEYKLVVGLSLIPHSIVLIYKLIQFLANQELSYRSFYFAYTVAWIFNIRILLIGVKYIQNFSNHKAVLNIFLPTIITEIIIIMFTY